MADAPHAAALVFVIEHEVAGGLLPGGIVRGEQVVLGVVQLAVFAQRAVVVGENGRQGAAERVQWREFGGAVAVVAVIQGVETADERAGIGGHARPRTVSARAARRRTGFAT